MIWLHVWELTMCSRIFPVGTICLQAMRIEGNMVPIEQKRFPKSCWVNQQWNGLLIRNWMFKNSGITQWSFLSANICCWLSTTIFQEMVISWLFEWNLAPLTFWNSLWQRVPTGPLINELCLVPTSVILLVGSKAPNSSRWIINSFVI